MEQSARVADYCQDRFVGQAYACRLTALDLSANVAELFETRIDMGLFDCNEFWHEGSQVRCPVLPLLLILLEASGKTEAPVSQIA